MNRRQYLFLGMATAVTSAAQGYGFKALVASNKSSSQQVAVSSQNETLFGAYDDLNGQHYASRILLNEAFFDSADTRSAQTDSSLMDSMAIPFRAHDTLPLSAHKSLSFGRRPDNRMVVCDFESKQQQLINANEGRHFYGHGCIHQNSQVLFTTENDYDNAKGVIGLRDSHTFQQIGEYQSYGVGPHDIHLMPDNKTLVVANGGIETHPDFGRRKLNIKTMQPSLVFIDIESGKKVDEYRLDRHKLSIRHLSVTPDGGIGIATQYQGQVSRDTPNYLLAWFDGSGVKVLKDSQEFTRTCRGYIGDVAVDPSGKILVASSPRGNNVSLWDIEQTRLIKTIQIPAPSGLCFDKQKQEFLVSNDKGVIYKIPLDSKKDTTTNLSKYITKDSTQLLATQLQVFPVKWDNHMIIHA